MSTQELVQQSPDVGQVCGVGVSMASVHHELADHTPETMREHTAAHLLFEGLRKVLGNEVVQCGAMINPKMLQFDFSGDTPLTPAQTQEIEKSVNDYIAQDFPVSMEELDVDEAKGIGILDAAREAKFRESGKKVPVCSIGDAKRGYVSRKLCLGFHANSTGELGRFKIKEAKPSPAGVRRIEADLE